MTELDHEADDDGFGLAGLVGHLSHGLSEMQPVDVSASSAESMETSVPTRPSVAAPPRTLRQPTVPALVVADAIIAAAARKAGAHSADVPRSATIEGPGFRMQIGLGERVIVGRADGPGRVSVPRLEISSGHFELELRADALLVTDLNSTNGTNVRSTVGIRKLVPGVAHRLAVGDVITVLTEEVVCEVLGIEGGQE